MNEARSWIVVLTTGLLVAFLVYQFVMGTLNEDYDSEEDDEGDSITL